MSVRYSHVTWRDSQSKALCGATSQLGRYISLRTQRRDGGPRQYLDLAQGGLITCATCFHELVKLGVIPEDDPIMMRSAELHATPQPASFDFEPVLQAFADEIDQMFDLDEVDELRSSLANAYDEFPTGPGGVISRIDTFVSRLHDIAEARFAHLDENYQDLSDGLA